MFLCVLVTGCSRKESTGTGQAVSEDQAVSGAQSVDGNKTLNDTDRLNKIVKRINQVIGSEHVVIFGGSQVNGSVTAVDYALFARLSDDGLAVMITDAILQRQAEGNNILTIAQQRLQMDEAIGKYIGLAGYKPDGFKEWLEQCDLISFQPQAENQPSVQRRIYMFWEGYHQAQSERKPDQTAMK